MFNPYKYNKVKRKICGFRVRYVAYNNSLTNNSLLTEYFCFLTASQSRNNYIISLQVSNRHVSKREGFYILNHLLDWQEFDLSMAHPNNGCIGILSLLAIANIRGSMSIEC